MALSAILGGLSLLSGISANNKQSKAASDAAKRGKKLEDRQVGLFDEIMNMVRQADAGGQFDPTQMIQQLENDTAKYEARDAGNLAGALRVAGYKPGDSEIGRRLDAVKMNYRDQLNRMRLDLRRGSFTDRLNAYQSANPGMLNPAISNAYSQQAFHMGQMQNPAGAFAAMMPFLQQQPDPKKQLASSLASGFRFMG